ncbi:MAG TPA: hypothetical protein DCS67_02885 [Clostridiales bacterium UBA8960]|nr:hypothetical protein [Clostridiales bacterium UBA8960]
MNKKAIIIGLVLLLGVAAFFGYNQFLGPNAQEGAKEVTIEIIAESQSISESFTFNTDTAFLYDLLVEKQETLKVEFGDGGFVTGLMGYTANAENKEFFSLLINGEFAMTGAKETPVEDGTVYKFELTTW